MPSGRADPCPPARRSGSTSQQCRTWWLRRQPDEISVERVKLAHHSLQRELPLHLQAALLSYAASARGVLKEPSDTVRHVHRIAGRNEKSGHAVLDDFGCSSDGGGHDRTTGCHGLKHRIGKALIVLRCQDGHREPPHSNTKVL